MGATSNGTVTINENGGIFNAALRPTANWNINGSIEMLYNDNAFTPMTPRQTRQYRVHTMYRPKPWATISGAYNDLEHHNNTNNNQAAVAANDGPAYAGPLDHVDYSRVAGMGAELFPNEHYGIDFNYAYSDVYMADNICYLGGAYRCVACCRLDSQRHGVPGHQLPAGRATISGPPWTSCMLPRNPDRWL